MGITKVLSRGILSDQEIIYTMRMMVPIGEYIIGDGLQSSLPPGETIPSVLPMPPELAGIGLNDDGDWANQVVASAALLEAFTPAEEAVLDSILYQPTEEEQAHPQGYDPEPYSMLDYATRRDGDGTP